MNECPENLVNQYLKIFDEIRTHHNFLAIGEIGLDKLKKNYEQQKTTLNLLISELLKRQCTRPFIFHCVKAFNDLEKILKQSQLNNICIWHEFNANQDILESALRRNFYFSLNRIFQGQKDALIAKIPLNRVFLELDDNPDPQHLKNLYQRLADIHKISLNELITQVRKNYDFIFDQSDQKQENKSL